jgi:CheY-like chemotaxis protein
VIEAHDPVTALFIARQQPIDAMVAAVAMPQLSGPELARQMRHYVPNLRVLFMSGHGGHSPSDDLAAAPLLRKPFTAEVLASALADVLRLSAGTAA